MKQSSSFQALSFVVILAIGATVAFALYRLSSDVAAISIVVVSTILAYIVASTIKVADQGNKAWSNSYLREQGHGVALNSRHMEAKAIDIRIPGIATAKVRAAALSLQKGGVGYYAQSEFCACRRWPSAALVARPSITDRVDLLQAQP